MSRMKVKVMGVLLVIISFFLTAGAICANASCTDITVSGIVRDMSGQVITGGVTVSLVSDPLVTTTTTTGSFSLANVPCSTPVALKMSSSGYLDLYTPNFSSTSSFNISYDGYGYGYFKIPTSAELTAMGVMPESGKTVLFGRVVDNTYRYSSNIAGAVVTATGSSKTYPVTYLGFNSLGGGSTYQNGNFFVLNVDASDTVVLQASKAGWTFSPATFSTAADSAGQTMLKGTAPAYDVSISGSVNDSSGRISGAGIKLNNDGGKNTTADVNGLFSLGSLPQDATFYLKVENIASPGTNVPAYVGPITLRESLSNAFLGLYTPVEMSNMGVTGGNGLLLGKVMDTTGTPISGATVTVASKNGVSYTAYYSGSGSSTNATGAFIVPDVQPGDVVRLDVTKAGYGFATVFMDCFGGAVTETNIYGTNFPMVDISKISYGDSVRQITGYDFSAGTKSGDIITIPAGFVTKPSPDEDSLSYTFGLYPGTTGETLSWTAPYPCIIQLSMANHNGAAIISTDPILPDVSSAQNAWSYSVKLQNFIVVSGEVDTIRFGLGGPDGNNQPQIEARWQTNGDLQLKGSMSGNTTTWESKAVVLSGLTPSETTLKLKVEEVTGTTTAYTVNFYYLIGGDSDYTLIGTYDIPNDIIVKGFPALFPFINLELGDDNTQDPFQVSSYHMNNSGGNNYYANIFVNDPDQTTYASISVASSGTPCGDPLSPTALTYNGNGQWWLIPSVFLSENTPPPCYPSYTFTAVKKESAGGGTVTETRTITSYVEDFATDLQPVGTVSGTPTFSWTEVTGASGYWVQLSDSSHNYVWGAWIDAPASSIIYSGSSALVSGTYYYTVNTNVCTSGGACNNSQAEGTFTYMAGGAADEFPIATSSGREMSISVATGAINNLVGIQGDASAFQNITAQLMSTSTGELIGPRISIGRTGSAPSVAFDGTNYLMVWADDATSTYVQYGQLISGTTGSLVGSPFIIAPSHRNAGAPIFDGINYFVAYEVRSNYDDGDTADVYGQFITTSGTLLGSAIPISTGSHGQRDPSLAFDGTNILIAWADGRNQSACYTEGEGSHCAESDTYGQFITKSGSGTAGTLSGGNFLISASSLPRDQMNPIVAFDGTRYLVIFPQETTLPNACPGGVCKWDIYGQFVTTTGSPDGSMITISNTSPDHHFPFLSWNANINRYLVTWTENLGTDSDIVKARYFNASGSSIGDEFVLFLKSDDGLIPLFAVAVPTTSGYLALVNRGVTGTSFDDMAKDVYGKFFSPAATESLYGSFTGAGIWKWDGSSWNQLTPYDPQIMTAAGSNLYAAFTGYGISKWDGSSWSQLTPYYPQMMTATGSNLYAAFTGYGISKWDGEAWSQLTPYYPQMMTAAGSNLYAAFTGYGISKWDGEAWSQLTPYDPQIMTAAGSNLYAAFTGYGISKWDGEAWSQLTPYDPQIMTAAGSNLYAAFTGYGISKWDGEAWSQLTPYDPQIMTAAGSNLYAAFTGYGISKWDGSSWSQLTSYEPASMVTGD